MKPITAFLLGPALLCALAANAGETCSGGQDAQSSVACRQSVYEKTQRDLKHALVEARARVRAAPADAGIDHAAVLKTLDASQRAWQQFVANDCRAQFQFAGSGTARNEVELRCLAQHYELRVHQLRRWGQE